MINRNYKLYRDERWDENLCQYALCGDNSLDPQHDGGHVTNRGEGTTGVGGDDDECSIKHTFTS